MRKLITIFLSIISLTLMAQAPQGVGYQGVATDANGIELVNQAISIRASVLSGSANGTIEWEETHATSTDTFGLFALTIGQGTSTGSGTQPSFSDISWGTNTHFLKIEMDVNGGTNYSFMGTNQMMSVPYSLHSKTAANVDPTDELQSLSISGDTIFISDGNHLVIPGISFITTLFKYGCTDALSCNYDPIANIDDSSCFPTPIVDMTAAPWSLIYHQSCLDSTITTNSYNHILFSANLSGIITNINTTNGNTSTTQFSWVLCDSILYLDIPSWGLIGPDVMESVYSNGSFPFFIPSWNTCGIISPCTSGCMDSTAVNYNPSATCDHGYCYVYGCTDNTMFNYDSLANTDDGSCIAVVFSCTDSTAYNYDASANIDDGSCIAVALGCTDNTMFNYDPLANTDDGSCIAVVFGCTDSTAYNYDVSANTDDGLCHIGDFREGGIVFWVDSTGQHGLVCDLNDLGVSKWGCYGMNVSGADGTTIGTGEQNTIDIINANCSPNNTAAELCVSSTAQGKYDWFLPSIDELNLIHLHKDAIDSTSLSHGGIALNVAGYVYYWTSSEKDADNAYLKDFTNYPNTISWGTKNNNCFSRAIRAF